MTAFIELICWSQRTGCCQLLGCFYARTMPAKHATRAGQRLHSEEPLIASFCNNSLERWEAGKLEPGRSWQLRRLVVPRSILIYWGHPIENEPMQAWQGNLPGYQVVMRKQKRSSISNQSQHQQHLSPTPKSATNTGEEGGRDLHVEKADIGSHTASMLRRFLATRQTKITPHKPAWRITKLGSRDELTQSVFGLTAADVRVAS